MKKWTSRFAVVSSGLLTSTLAFAGDGDTSALGLAKLGAGFAIGIGAFGAATGQGKAAQAALEGIARNPTSRSEVFVPMILALAFIEFQAFLSFAIAIMLAG